MNNKIRQGFEDMAPDIFAQIKASPYEMIHSEEELFSELMPKQVVKPKAKKRFWYSATSLAAAAAIMLCLMTGTVGHVDAAVGEIYLDADASIILEVDENNQVIGVKAGNEDAEGIVKEMQKDANFPANIGDMVGVAITELNKEGHKTEDILVSYCYEEKKVEAVEEAVATSAEECTVQSFQKDEEAIKEAQGRKMSAALRHFERSAGKDVIFTASKEEKTSANKEETNASANTNVAATTSATPVVKKQVKRHWRTTEPEVSTEPVEEESDVINPEALKKLQERQQKYRPNSKIETTSPSEE